MTQYMYRLSGTIKKGNVKEDSIYVIAHSLAEAYSKCESFATDLHYELGNCRLLGPGWEIDTPRQRKVKRIIQKVKFFIHKLTGFWIDSRHA